MPSFQRENRPIVGVGVGKGKTMHDTNGVEFATAHLATDVTLHYAERGDREGEAIIFLHGYSDSWYSFGRVLPLLSPEYDAFALTQRAHGDSDKPECCYTVDDYAADVDAFMDALGIERATVVGASTGAFFAQRAVLSYPHRVSRLALIAAQTPANEIISSFRQEVRAGRSRAFRVRQGVPGEHDPPSGPGRIPCNGGLREPQASGPRLARLHGRGGAFDRSGLRGRAQ